MKKILVMLEKLELWTNFKRALLLATTVFVGGSAAAIWLFYIAVGPFKLYGTFLPMVILTLYISGLAWLYRRQASLRKLFLFALMGLIVFLFYGPIVIFLTDMAQ